MSDTAKCLRCGGLVRLDRTSCPACGAVRGPSEVESAQPAPAPSTTAVRREDVETRVRARVMWGDPLPEIRDEQVKLGVKPVEVDGIIRRAVQDRKDYYRRLGKKNLSTGIGLLLLGTVAITWFSLFIEGGIGRIPVWVIAATIALPVGGILLLVKGIQRIRRPGEGESMAEGAEEGE